ncbi:hypothetical protein BZA77DRAFT_157441 [Pyronema omphalodes]|nr:hypothetical protein BZA77DRAFT_157441 [Pyronema omphalodes]
MDPLSIAAAAAGFATLAGQILSILKNYVDGVQSAPDGAKSLLLEVEAFCQVITSFDGFIQSGDLKGRIFEDSSVLRKAIEACGC